MSDSIDRLYENYVDIIRNRAWSFTRHTGLEYEDLIGEANLRFCIAARTYNPTLGSFTTHLYHVITNGLIKYTKQMNEWNEKTTRLPQEDPNETDSIRWEFITQPPNPLWFHDFLSQISKESQAVLYVLFNKPQAVLGLIGSESPRAIRAAISCWLQKQGVSFRKRNDIIREIKNAVETLQVQY